MRQFQKQQLLDIIDSLHILHKEIRQRTDLKNLSSVKTALADCQEAAIQIGEAIERMTENGKEAVCALELYCEKLYVVNEQVEIISAHKIYKILEENIIKAENAIIHIPTSKEIVFLPYKASMWDSLEGIYQAAKEEQNSNVYCIPIPYYDKNIDGSLGELHYEGHEYPGNVEVVDYRTYNLEERHPDIIYIHNPYDEWNNVTCVPERYFSRNLRENTEKLIYIPYFILEEIDPNNKGKIEKMKHFCFLPGVIYAHKVIVQSENMRQIYISEYIKEAEKLGLPTNKKIIEEKILGLGSPKIDKVQNTKKESLEIPEKWTQIIKRTDGKWKKIIFYNTSINALLRYDADMLEKMKSVFGIFRVLQDEAVLLWRPHPLLLSTIKSMRPHLLTAYEKIVEDYRNSGWGIYDDSSDMDRAVVISDIYYGDSSSVAQLYRSLGKPVYIQRVNWTGITLGDSCCCNGIYFFLDCNGRQIYYLEEESSVVKEVESISYHTEEPFRFSGIISNGHDIVLLPQNEKFIYVYDTELKKVHKIGKMGNSISTAYVQCDRYVYMFPCQGKEIIELDMTNYEQRSYEISQDVGEKHSIIKAFWICKDSIYVVVHGTGVVIEFNIVTKTVEQFNIGCGQYKYVCICGDNKGQALLISECGKIMSWSPETEKIEIVCRDNNLTKYSFWKSIYVKETNEAWFFPYEMSAILVIDMKTGNRTSIDMELINDYQVKEPVLPQVWMANQYGKYIWINTCLTCFIARINIYSKEIDKIAAHKEMSFCNIKDSNGKKVDWKKKGKIYGLF